MAKSTNIDPKVLQDYVATANSGKYKSWDEINSKFPEFKGVSPKLLQDYVATANSGKYKSWDDINSKFPEFQKKKDQGAPKVEPPKPVTTTVSKSGSVPTQPTDGSKPSQGEPKLELQWAGGAATAPKITAEADATLVSSDKATKYFQTEEYKLAEEKKKKEQQAKYDSQVQGVLSYLKYSPKDILLDDDALNQDIEFLKKNKGYSDQAIMAGIDEYKRSQQKKKTDNYLGNQYAVAAQEMQLNPDLPDEEKKRITEGVVLSKALQAGVESMTSDEKQAYIMLGDLKKVNQQLNADPGNNALVAKSADLKQKIGSLLDNSKMLFDPVTGQLVDRPTPETEKYQAEVNAAAAKLKSENAEDKLAKIYMSKYGAFKYWDDLYDQNQRNLASGYTLGVSPDEFKNKQIREAKTIKDNWIKAKRDFDVAKKSYLLNRDPSGIGRDYGLKAAGEVFLETITPQVVQDMLPEGMLPTTDRMVLEISKDQLERGGIELTPAMKERFKKSLTEEIVEGTGGLMGILPKLWFAGRIVEGGAILTTLDDAILTLRNGNAFEKSLSFILRGAMEEAKTQTAGFAPGVGVGFQVAGETIRIPRLKGKFGTILQPVLDAAIQGSVGGTVGMELGEVVAKTVDVLGTNQEWNDKMDELFPDFDTVERRIVTNLVINGLFGIAHMPKGSLTFSPEKLMEMSRKMEKAGRKEEANYLSRRAAELAGYQKVDMQIKRGATGVAGRRSAQEQRPVVAEPPAPAPAPAPVAEAAPAPAPAPKPKPAPIVETKPKEKSPVTIAESIESGRVYDRDGEKGVLKQEGQIVVLEKSNGDVIELGNIDQVKDQSISDFNIKETTEIKLNDDNSFDVDGKTYVNNYSTPESAISVDKDGNYSVTLDTPDGKKRTFRGDRGEEMAYQIKLKQLENARDEQSIDRAIELADEAIATEGKTTEVATTQEARDIEQVITESGRKAESVDDAKAAFSEGKEVYVVNEMDGEPMRVNNVTELDTYQPDQISIIEAKPEAIKEGETVKPKTDAVQVETAGEVPVQPETGTRQEVAEGKPETKPEEVAEKSVEKEVADIEAASAAPADKKAEIERIRQEKRGEALISIGVDEYGFDKLQRKDWREAKNYDLKRAISIAENQLQTNPNSRLGSIPQNTANAIRAELKLNGIESSDKTPISEIIEQIKEINAKYDAELAALKERPQAGVQEKVALEEQPKEEKPAAKQSDKEIKKQAEKRLKDLSQNFYNSFNEISKDGVVIINNKGDKSTFGVIIDPKNKKDIDGYKSKVKEWALSQGLKFEGETIDEPRKKDVLNFSFGSETQQPKAEEPATKKESKPKGAKYGAGDKVVWGGEERPVISSVKVGNEFKYQIDLGEGKTIWTNEKGIEAESRASKAEKPVPAKEEPAPTDAAAFLKEKLGLGKPKAEEPAAKTTEQKIEEAQKTVDDAAAWLKEKLKINTVPPDTKIMGTSTDALIDVAADAVKQLVAAGIKTADAIKQVVDALREGGFLKGLDEKDFTNKLETGKTPQPTGGITWLKVVPGKGDVKIGGRNPVVTQAAKDLLNGKITNEQYRDIVEQNAAIGPITRFFEPATEQQVKDALSSEKVKNANKPIANGTKVGLRLDIPAFNNNNTWVVSVHEGHSKKSPVLSYTSVGRVENVSFGAAPNETIRMAAGSFKDAVQKIYGEWSEIPGNNPTEKIENAKRMVEDIINNPDWIQVGVNPFRHSYFYDRSRDPGRPLISADEVIQIGGLVYAKNPVYGKWTDAAYRVKGLLDAAGKEVRFSKRTGKPEYVKPVDQIEKDIVDELNSMELVNKSLSIAKESTTGNKIDVNGLNESLDNPLRTVKFEDYDGIPFMFDISDQLRAGKTVNPFTGQVIENIQGGIGFNGIKGNENFAWAKGLSANVQYQINTALEIYNNNKPLFDRLWKEGRLPDGHIPMAIVKMGETSIMSNEAVFRMGVQNIETLPLSNRRKAVDVMKKSLTDQINNLKRDIQTNKDPKKGNDYSPKTIADKKKELARTEKILKTINDNKFKDIVDLLKDALKEDGKFSMGERPVILDYIFYGEPTPIGGKPVKLTGPKKEVAIALIGNKNPELIHIGKITDALTEPSMKDIPNQHIVAIVGIDVKNPEVLKTNHPNYPYAPKGKSIGILEQPIHAKDAFGEAYANVVAQIIKNESRGVEVTFDQAMSQGIPTQSGLTNKVLKGAIARNRLDAFDKLAGFVRQAFPKTTFFTSKEAWETIIADPSIKKEMKDGEVVYGLTTDGRVFINPELKSNKVLLHESGHLWEDFVKENNPKLWEKGESLVSNTKELAEAQKMYGDTPKARSEALMEIMSTKGDTIVNETQKADFKEWMLGLWKYIGEKFSSLLGLSPKEIENLTLDQFVEGMLADILSGKELKAGKHVADTKASKAEMAENARFSKQSGPDAVADVAKKLEGVDVSDLSETVDIPQVLETKELDKIPRGGTFQEKYAPEYFEKLKEDIKKNGIKEPIILKYYVKDNAIRLMEGHHRLKIAKELGIENVPVKINVVWGTSIKEGNEDIKGKPIVSPPTSINIEKYRKRDYAPSNIKVEELGYKNDAIASDYVKAKADGSNPELVNAVEAAIGKPTTEQRISDAERTIDNAAAWLKDKLKVTGLPEGTKTMGMSQEDLIDLVAVAAKKLVSKGIKVNQAIKQIVDSLRDGGFLANMDEKEISKASRRRMSPSYEADMYKVHERLVDMANDYIANGGTSRKEFASQIGVKEKNVEEAWNEATGVRTYNKDQIDRRLADMTKTAIARGFNVRKRLEEMVAKDKNIRSSINNFLRSKELYAMVNAVQAKALARRAANVKTMEQLDKFIDYADKVINDANYAQDMADIRKMQDAAKRNIHTGNTKAVKDFASINPEKIPDNRMDEYMQALDELAGRVPDYATMQRIYFDVVNQTTKAKDFSNITTFNKASDMFDSIMSNEIKSVEDYRKLFADINGLKRRLKQLVENETITMDEYDAIMDNIGKTTTDVKNRFAGKIDGLKNELVDDIRSKTLNYRAQNKEEQKIIDAFKEQTDSDLRRLEPEDLWEMNELIDRANDGNFDYYRWNGVIAEAEKMRRGEILGQQLKDAKRLDRAEAQSKLAKQESTFIEGTLGLGRAKAGAVSKYIVSEVERAAGSYNVAIKDGLNALMKAKGKLDKESMHKMGMVITYLQEYMAQFNPKWAKTQNIGTRDWFGEMLSNPDMMDAYAAEKVQMGLFRGGEKTKADLIQKIYDSLPKDPNGKVDPKAVYESIMNKDGRFLNAKEQAMLDTMMEYIDTNIKPKQEAANFSRGMDFESLSYYMPRLDLTDRMDIETKVDISRNRVRVKSGFGEERKSQEVRPIEVDFEVAITRAIEAANRDYHFGKALDMVNGTLGYAAKAGGASKNMATIIATNIKDMMEFEFARKQSDAAATVGGLLLSARAAQTLLDPVRTVLVELPATFLQVPLRSRNVSGYVDILNPTNGKLFQDLLEYSESPLRLRENISRAIDIDQGAIKPQAMKDKALAFLAGAPERITMIGSWMPTFKNEFKKITGETFDANKFQSDPNYRKKFSRAIKEAATSADMTTQKIIGTTTKLSQAREIELPIAKKGPSKDAFWGKTLGFFGNYPRREYLEFVNGFKEIGERYRQGEGVSSFSSISKPLSVAMGTLTYGYMASLVYALKQYYFGTDDEKEKATEALERMSSTEGVVEEGISQGIALAGSKYYTIGRVLTSGMTLVAYNMTEDPEQKKQIARLYKNTFYADPIDPDGSKTFNSKDNKEKMALHLIRFIPQLSIAVDKFQQGLEAYGGYEKLMDRHDQVGFEKLTSDEKDLWLLGDIILKAGGIVANLYGTAIPMEKTLQTIVRGNLDVASMSKEDVEDLMQQRIDNRIKTPEERKESYEQRMKRRKKEMELRKLSKEYGIRYYKSR